MQIEFIKKVLKSKLLSLEDKAEWSAYLNRLPESMQDVYYTPEYYEIYENNGDGKALCFVFEEENHLAMYPFLLNRINDLGYELDKYYYDIQGAYGYNGIVCSTDDPDFIKRFYNEFNRFCVRNDIVAEFTRFHPLLKNHKTSEGYLDVSYNRQTVYVDLTKGYNAIYKNYNKNVKRYLRFADKNNLFSRSYEKVFPYKNEFVKLYTENMIRVNSVPYLYFNNNYFENSFKNLPLAQIVIFKESVPVASTINLFGKIYAHGHLGGSKVEFLHLGVSTFLYDSMIRFSLKKGYQKIHFGGGNSSYDNDPLLKFKEKFSNDKADFFVGKRILNKEIYDRIIEQWNMKYPHLINKYKNYFLKYARKD